MAFKSILDHLSPECPGCRQKLWPNRIRRDASLKDDVRYWYEYSDSAIFCTNCNTRLRGKRRNGTLYVLFMLFIVPWLNAFVAPALIRDHGLPGDIALVAGVILLGLWLVWFGEKYEVYRPDNQQEQ